ncbi:serine protein kinase RIO [Deinococcus sp. Arct2-2]|uniref:RIO1 family regulatory kinase/ATPase domain-containing protein n=1 Tax=Deinococcus sp. Arct2-2 TaxID=2568653 RepID=UPI0010A353BE|nr:RIO1 family regulatory kinase/ATPase [Deinococcus sp. Arct2-2]THF70159.1 serine protein kinase RIO [Deinococcus sp. Arct2-2]
MSERGGQDWLDTELNDLDTGPERKEKHKVKKPLGRRKLATLKKGAEGEADEIIKRLTDLGHITEIVAELKSGKEATAYVARGPRGSILVKLYRELEARSFKNDAIYREGQTILDERARKAMQSRSLKGLAMLQMGWVTAEYAHLWKLWNAGLSVPEPLVGPSPFDYEKTTPAVLMRLIGTEDAPAPRLSDAVLTPTQARSAWEQSLNGMAHLLRLGYAHGDYSTYNLLWQLDSQQADSESEAEQDENDMQPTDTTNHTEIQNEEEGTVVIIDFPQLTTQQNPNFAQLLRRDADSLSMSFRRHDIYTDGEATLREVQKRALGPAPTPRVVLP